MTSDRHAPPPAPAAPTGADAPVGPAPGAAAEPGAATAPLPAATPTPGPAPTGTPTDALAATESPTAVLAVTEFPTAVLVATAAHPTVPDPTVPDPTVPHPGAPAAPAGAASYRSVPPYRAATPSVDDDLRVVAPALAGGRELALVPVRPATWRAVSQATVGVWVLGAAALAAFAALSLTVALAILVVGVGLLVLTLVVARPLAAFERARLHAQLGVDVAAPRYRRTSGGGWWRRAWDVVVDVRPWGHLAYAGLGFVITVLQSLLVWVLGGFAVAMVASPLYIARTDIPVSRLPFLVVGGLLATWVWPAALQALTLLQVRLARGLLGWPRSVAAVQAARVAAEVAQERASQAEVRAVQLRETRTRAVGTAEDDRRRIERDLHDGAQQRLVALGVELGVAKRAAAQDPVAAAAALDHAHREVKETLAELRDLVRGIHPAVLTDRGLDAALSALAARCTVPVTVDVPDAASLSAAGPSAQAAAYFVTAEALTNVARHSGARTATVRATVHDGLLRLEVVDDGRGGATARPGSGLDGLRSRVEVLDGTLTLDSPVGSGTRLTVEVPCAS